MSATTRPRKTWRHRRGGQATSLLLLLVFFLEKGKEERSGKTEPAENDWLVWKGRLSWPRANPAKDDRKTLKYVPKNGAGKEGEICRTSMQYKTDQTETEGNYRIMKGCGHFFESWEDAEWKEEKEEASTGKQKQNKERNTAPRNINKTSWSIDRNRTFLARAQKPIFSINYYKLTLKSTFCTPVE